ncbi:hypothetical protein [Staphylococcus arlettae]|nr:hypothetical protein [Staphylococcus arlettae]MCP8713492.1 hypothetical protein [Staphylococcus arlettae]
MNIPSKKMYFNNKKKRQLPTPMESMHKKGVGQKSDFEKMISSSHPGKDD